MKQEDKKLLIKDISARLPYGVYVEHITTEIRGKVNNIRITHLYNNTNSVQDVEAYIEFFGDSYIDITYFKPYLRPMSSMTEEEKKEFNSLINSVEERCINAYGKGGYTLAFIEVNDWLNSHHFDYRGLIEKGLALEAPDGMYN